MTRRSRFPALLLPFALLAVMFAVQAVVGM